MLTQREMFEAGWEYGTQRVTEYGDKCPDFPEGCGLPGSKPTSTATSGRLGGIGTIVKSSDRASASSAVRSCKANNNNKGK